MSIIRAVAVVLLWSLCVVAWAGTADDWRVTELRINAPATSSGVWYQGGSPLTRGFAAAGTDVAMYAIEVVPGLQYTVQLSVPLSPQHIHAYLYDRWPLLAGVRRIALPGGPLVVSPRARRVVYRWRIGIAARSGGSLLYLMVRYPRGHAHHSHRSPRIAVYSPPLLPDKQMGEGVTYLDGPRQLLLVGDTPAVSYLLQPVATADGEATTPRWTPPGDLISNGQFHAGLKNWVPQVTGHGRHAVPRADAAGLTLHPGVTLRQQLDADVAPDTSLVLWAELRLESAPRGVVAPGLIIALCYHDADGADHCGDAARRIRFYPTTTTAQAVTRTGRSVPPGHWYHFQTDISGMEPPLTHVDSVALTATGTTGAVQLRAIHLITGSDDNATH